MKCAICEGTDWHWRKDLNPHKEVGICKGCGFVSFKIEEGEEEKIKEFYRNNYRNEPNSGNIITTTRKLNYIKMFLSEWLKDKKNLICADYGAATGYLCDWFRRIGHKATGCELTKGYRRFSEHYYGVPLTEKLETKHKYDIVVFYHTLEHLIAPEEKLNEVLALLQDGGVVMVSVPEWFFELHNLAQIGKLTIDNYFHKNHINCFSRKSAHNLFAKCGFKVIKEDYQTLGQTYLLQKTDKPEEIQKENWEDINKKIDKIKSAIDLFHQKKYKEAKNIWYNFPEAHLNFIFDIIKKDPERQQHELTEIMKTELSESVKIITAYAVWCYQNTKYEEALKLLDRAIAIAPNEDMFVYVGWCFDRLGKHPEAMRAFSKAMQINPQKWTECINWMGHSACQMPTWDERAEAEVKEQLFKKANPKINLSDPAMESKENEKTKK